MSNAWWSDWMDGLRRQTLQFAQDWKPARAVGDTNAASTMDPRQPAAAAGAPGSPGAPGASSPRPGGGIPVNARSSINPAIKGDANGTLAPGEPIYVRLRHEPEETLGHRGIITVQVRTLVTAEFSPPLHPDRGQKVMLHYIDDGKLFQVGGKTQMVLPGGSRTQVRFELFGEHRRIERRRAIRTSVAGAGLTADFGRMTKCPMLDVSVGGFAVAGQEGYRVGDSVSATLRYGELIAMGKAYVRNCRTLRDGRIRYGLEVGSAETALQKWLQAVSVLAGRKQLGRLASRR